MILPKPAARLLWCAGAKDRKVPRVSIGHDTSAPGVSLRNHDANGPFEYRRWACEPVDDSPQQVEPLLGELRSSTRLSLTGHLDVITVH